MAQPAAASKSVTLPKPELPVVRMGNAAVEPTQFPYKSADDLGLYQKYGFERVETSTFDGAGKLDQAFVAGQLDAMMGAGNTPISSLVTDVPTIVVASGATRATDILVAKSDIKSAADLKGQTVAISQFGAASHVVVLLLLKRLGLTPSDVTIVQDGGEASRMASLRGGSVAAIPVDIALEALMKEQATTCWYGCPIATRSTFARASSS
jgi:ABC-type nitrate/sulfonate/bicarbonate transport system substrate-binding protein